MISRDLLGLNGFIGTEWNIIGLHISWAGGFQRLGELLGKAWEHIGKNKQHDKWRF